MTKITITAIRNALREKFGARMYRITATGEIHAYGTMPNTNIEGWYVFGAVADRGTLHRLELGDL